MRKFYSIFLFLCLLSPLLATAQSYVLKGIVVDAENKQPLVGTTVVIDGTSTGTMADAEGKFKLPYQGKLPVMLRFSYIGFEPYVLAVADEKPVKVALKKKSIGGRMVIIQDSRISDKQKQAPLTVETMDIIGIKETPAANFYEGLGQLKGVDLTSASIGFKVINMRGFNSTSPVRSLQMIDGVDNQAPGLNFSLGNFLGASDLDVQGVDLVVGASSAFYGPNAFNGVISMRTKDPFIHKGLSASVKFGERNLFETAVRYAKAFKDNKGRDAWAFKFNLFYLKVNDWQATNMAATPQSTAKEDNPGGYDAVNRYGDERRFSSDFPFRSFAFPGLNYYYRTGYMEKDIVDYGTENLKLNTAFHFRLGQQKDKELVMSSNFGTGTTIYQGDNRYSLKDILFFQNRLELKDLNDKWYIRAYATNEDAGRSYDAVLTAVLLQQAAKSDNAWTDSYLNTWRNDFKRRVEALPGYPPFTFPVPDDYFTRANAVMANYIDSLRTWHNQTRAIADGGSTSVTDPNSVPYFQPGTARFDSAFQAITSRKSFAEGGSGLFDRSALYHIMGLRKFSYKNFNFTLAANARQYSPNSRGTIFSDTIARIVNREIGFSSGVERKIYNEKINISATLRIDKNQNFNWLLSPAASAVYTSTDKKHILRLSFSSAIRNPTLQDQYLNYNLGTARLVGNLNGYNNLVTIPSLLNFLDFKKRDSLVYFNLDPIRPERARTIEAGYRATLFKHLYIDASMYYSFYKDFIGFKIGSYFDFDSTSNLVNNVRVLRVAANSSETVTTRGATIGLNYYFKRFYAINGNYSYNELNRSNLTDSIIPAFNTPRHKFNIGISGREIETVINVLGQSIKLNKWGFNINYKWVEGFVFEGSPQFTGAVPTYSLLDAQINHTVERLKTTIKLGASNLLNNKVFQVYGGPQVGRLAYISITLDVK